MFMNFFTLFTHFLYIIYSCVLGTPYKSMPNLFSWLTHFYAFIHVYTFFIHYVFSWFIHVYTFCFIRYDNSRLVTGGLDGKVRVWAINKQAQTMIASMCVFGFFFFLLHCSTPKSSFLPPPDSWVCGRTLPFRFAEKMSCSQLDFDFVLACLGQSDVMWGRGDYISIKK